MTNQLLGVTTTATLRPVQYSGLPAFCSGWAGDREGTVYASLIGRVTAVTGIWAAFMDNVELQVQRGRHLRKLPKLDGAKYHTIRVRLPDSDWLHLVLLHTQATIHNLPGEPFFILNSTSDPPLEAFWIQWNNALPLPAFKEWAPRLWELGRYDRVIVPCDAEGTHCWRIKANALRWGAILKQIVMEEQQKEET